MHRVNKGRGRSLMLLVLVLATVALFGIFVAQALALPTFNQAAEGIGPCDKCHAMTATHDKHSSVTCDKCHVSGTSTPPLPTACASCHTAATIMANAAHTVQKCGTTPGCHGYVAPVVATIAIDTVKPSKAVKVKTKMTLSGGVTPIDTAAQNVAWVVQFKKSGKWIQVKAGSAALGFLGGAMRFAFPFQPKLKGSYRAQASFFNLLGGSKTTSAWVAFKAK